MSNAAPAATHPADMTTYIRKDTRGNWRAETDYPFDAHPKTGALRILRLYTGKSERGEIYSSANVHTLSERGSITHMVFADFSGTIFREKIRCTEKNVVEQHTRLKDRVNDIIEAARGHYAAKGNS